MVVRRRLRRAAVLVAALGAAAAAIATGNAGQPRLLQRRCRYRPAYQYRRRLFSFRRWNDAKLQHLCCFSKAEIEQLVPLLRLKEIRWSADIHPTGATALCVLLCRLAYLGRLTVIADHFGRSPSWCSMVFNDVAVHLWTTFCGLLE
jgi:hypothetical protein